MEKPAALMYCDALAQGGYPDDCPFDSTRPLKMYDAVNSLGLMGYSHCRTVSPTPVSREAMERFHEPEYLEAIIRCGRGEHDFNALRQGLGTPDSPVFKDMFDYLALACGGTLDGARLIMEGDAHVVFNPAGGFHHAGPAAASGFCFINDVVVACMTMADAGKRVVVVDLDAHHGDGTQDAFYSRADVTTISMHESGKTLFPGTGFASEIGKDEGLGHCVNIPLPVGTHDDTYYPAFAEVVLPLVKKIDPDVIVMVLGMDALAGDPLAHLNLTNNCYADMVADVVEAGYPILATGGGGYDVENTVRGWSLMWSILSNGRDDNAAALGMGGVLLENTAWFGGLRDRTLLSHGGYREAVEKEIKETVALVKKLVFPIHGL